ncbi:hypothetical protein LAZ67_19001675 [Cordylochernes scorpioides]|uniref:RNA-directed DNA polymerase n=1 Tax=Cordylochernes scorpioides TaxID=51811 RepID=A0ABY6LIV4_9ARAC|nr:hypothetical protein LAZ67_19001675 [Cordylochernes scorpioides]
MEYARRRSSPPSMMLPSSSSAQEQHLLALLEGAITRWVPSTRGLSLVGRARAANSLVLSAVGHHLHGYLPTDSTIAKLQARLMRFVWGPQRTAWLPGGVLARPVSVGGLGLLDIGTQLRLACLKGVQAALTRKPQRLLLARCELLRLWEAVSEILELNHLVLSPHQLQELHVIGDCRFLRPLDLLVASRWAGLRVGDITSSSSLSLRTTRATLADVAALTTFCSQLVEQNRNHTHRVDNIENAIVLRGTATPLQRLTTRTARRMLERPRLTALPITQLLGRWLPHVSIPISISWSSLRRGAYSDHNADVAVRLALHALPHPAHPASARESCIACGSGDLSLATASGHRPPDLQSWIFGHDLEDNALAIMASAKTRIYKYFLVLEDTLLTETTRDNTAPRQPSRPRNIIEQIKVSRQMLDQCRSKAAAGTFDQMVYLEYSPEFTPVDYIKALGNKLGKSCDPEALLPGGLHRPCRRLCTRLLGVCFRCSKYYRMGQKRMNCPRIIREANTIQPSSQKSSVKPAPASNTTAAASPPAALNHPAPVAVPAQTFSTPPTQEAKAPETEPPPGLRKPPPRQTSTSVEVANLAIARARIELDPCLQKLEQKLALFLLCEQLIKGLGGSKSTLYKRLSDIKSWTRSAQELPPCHAVDIAFIQETNVTTLDSVEDLLGIQGRGCSSIWPQRIRPCLHLLIRRPGHRATGPVPWQNRRLRRTIRGIKATFINCHLSHAPDERLQQLQAIEAAAVNEDAWVLGDLNISEESASDIASGSVEALGELLNRANLVDAAAIFDAAHLPTRISSCGSRVDASRLDRVLLPSRLSNHVTRYWSLYYKNSDHRAVLLQIGEAPEPRPPCIASMLRSRLAHLYSAIKSLHDLRNNDDDYISRARKYVQINLEDVSINSDYPSLPDLGRALRLRCRGTSSTTFYDSAGRERFSHPSCSPEDIDGFLRGFTLRVTIEESDPLHRYGIGEEEIVIAIGRLPTGKTDGWDDLPCELFRGFEDFFTSALRRVFEAPSRTSTSLLANDGPQESSAGSSNGDCDRISGTSYLNSRATPEKTPLAVVATDLESAFYTLDRGFLMSVLLSVGLPPVFVGWVLLLYAGAEATARIEGIGRTPLFHMLNGVRQGCAASAAFFTISTGPLLLRLEQLLGRDNVLAYANDIVLLIREDGQLEVVKKIFEDFRRASGIRVNFGNSQGPWCGRWRNRTDFPVDISWNREKINILGTIVTPGVGTLIQDQHLQELLERAIAKCSPFVRGLSLAGRAKAANSLVLSAIYYHLQAYLPSETTIARLQARLARFVWGHDRTSWLPGSILARPISVGGMGLLDVGTQRRLSCLKGVQAALRGGRNAHSWLAESGMWLSPASNPDTWLPPRRRRSLHLFEAAAKILELNHRILQSIVGDCRFLRLPELLAPTKRLGWRIGELTEPPPNITIVTRGALADAAALESFYSRLITQNARGRHRVASLADAIVVRGTTNAFQCLTTRTARRMLERPCLAALPIAQLLGRWLPHVGIPISLSWSSLRRCAFSGHNADVAVRLALHALPHPAHPASTRESCIACGSGDLSLAHRYWSCRRIRPVMVEAFTIIQWLPDLQIWISGHDLEDDALAIVASTKTRIYKHFLGLKMRGVRAQKPDESVELYIQDVLNLCRQLNPNMSEEDRVGHLMKGVAENIYRALLAIEVTTTGEFTQHCRRIEKLNKNRISSVRFERIPTVSAINENEYHPLKEMIREIIREELRSAPNELDNLPPPQGLEDRVWQRVEQNLAPIDKAPVFHSRRAVKNFRSGQQNAGEAVRRKTDEFRTRENIPICFYCNRPGHVAKHCWDRRRDRDENEPRPIRGTTSLSIGRHHSLKCTKRVLTRTPSVTGIKNCAVEGARQLFLEKELFVPSSYLTIWHGQAYLWVTNFSKHPKTIPSGMCLAHLFRVQPQEVCPIMENHSNNKSKSAKSPIRIANFECREENFFKVGSSEQLMRMEQISACISPELPLLHKTKLLELLENFSEVFGPIDKTTSRIITKHRINTGDAKPSKKMPYRVSPSERKVIQEEVDRMMEMGVVQPSESPWASPVVLVRKKDGSVRFCVDYRGLNKMTKKDVYPLPRVDDALDCLKGANIYSTIDLKASYWQIGIDEADREKTAFITPDGLFEFKVMPFGLCNAPATFERMMDNLLKGLRWTICLCYLDDVVIFADNFPDHLRRLEVVLNCFKRAGLKLNPGKCSFGASNIKILGHQVDKDGIRPDDDKIKAVSQFPIPKNLQQLRSFLGLSSYYRRFIKNYADIARPLNSLLSKGTKFQWNTDQERAFQKLKNALTSKPVLGHFDDDAPTELHTDASGYGIGAVLAQKQGNGEKVIAYASRTLLKSEKNYSTTERECLAIVWAIGKFRPYLFGRPFKVITDHHSLCWLTNLKDPAGRLARWALRLQEYDVSIVYKTGRMHKDADCLSRNPIENTEKVFNDDIPTLFLLSDISKEQEKDPYITGIIKEISQPSPAKKDNKFGVVNGILYRKNYDPTGLPLLLVIPRHLRMEILGDLHDAPTAGHLGFAKTYDRIRRRFYWPGMYRSVRRYVGHCQDCQRRKSVPQLPPGYLRPIPPPDRPFQKVGIDLLGRFPISQGKKKWIVVCTDYLTKYAVTQSLGSGGAQEIAKFLLEEVILKHGAPREIVMDRGRNFQSRLIQELTKNCHIKKKTTTAYHPQTNGLTERLNRTIADMLSMYMDLDQKNWDEMLPFITFAYNTARQVSTGFTPFFLVHGREAETTLDTIFPYSSASEGEEFIQLVASRAEEARQIARHHIFKAQETNKLNYDARHKGKVYQPGDLVWIFTPIRRVGLSEKLLKRYFGPYKVIKKISDVTYEVEAFGKSDKRRKGRDTVHILRMKPYYDPSRQEDSRQVRITLRLEKRRN